MTMHELAQTGQVRGIAVTSAARASVAPQLPTMAESGLPGYELTNWLGIVGPARMDPTVLALLNGAVVDALGSTLIKRELRSCGMEAVGSSPSEFALHSQSERARWARIVKDRIAREPSGSPGQR